MFRYLRRLDDQVLRLERHGWPGVLEALLKGYAAYLATLAAATILVYLVVAVVRAIAR